MSKPTSRHSRSPRACALHCLIEWDTSDSFAAEILDHYSTHLQLDSRARASAMQLFYGILRNRSFLDRVISTLRQKGKLKPATRALLQLGLYQILFSDTADHAAVNETVSLARKHERNLVNAILRNTIRQRDAILDDSNSWPIAERLSHPAFLIDRWTAAFGAEITTEICRWNNRTPSIYARICDEESLHRLREQECTEYTDRGYRVRPVSGYPEFIELPPGPMPQQWIDSGAIYIQDPSTSLAPWLLAPEPGETILDACAAPGGKTAMLAAMSPDSTRIIATDSNPDRIGRMRENFDRLENSSIEIRQVDWADPTEEQVQDLPQFDAILLDVPCSNTGVMQRRIDVRWRLQTKDFQHLHDLQQQILSQAKKYLKPGGRIIYSTCSIDPSENEAMIEDSGMRIQSVRHTRPWIDQLDGAFAADLRLPG